jgi:hypothetical protein
VVAIALGNRPAPDVEDSRSSIQRAVAIAQDSITSIYRLDLPFRAENFVVTVEAARAILPADSPRSGVVIREGADPDEIEVGLYVDAQDAADPNTVVEETSHLVYLGWLALRDLSVSRLVLELQGEVDRYAVAKLTGRNGLDHFEQFDWSDWMDAATKRLYLEAHRRARDYCHALERRFPDRSDTPGLLDELRRYYRATPEQKLRAIG